MLAVAGLTASCEVETSLTVVHCTTYKEEEEAIRYFKFYLRGCFGIGFLVLRQGADRYPFMQLPAYRSEHMVME